MMLLAAVWRLAGVKDWGNNEEAVEVMVSGNKMVTVEVIRCG